VIEHAPDPVQIEHYQRLRFEQVNVEIVALVLLPEPPNQIHCERVGMDFIPKGNPKLVLSENTSKIVRDNLTKVKSNAVSDGDRGDRLWHDALAGCRAWKSASNYLQEILSAAHARRPASC
jgi:hypothetical protein